MKLNWTHISKPVYSVSAVYSVSPDLTSTWQKTDALLGYMLRNSLDDTPLVLAKLMQTVPQRELLTVKKTSRQLNEVNCNRMTNLEKSVEEVGLNTLAYLGAASNVAKNIDRHSTKANKKLFAKTYLPTKSNHRFKKVGKHNAEAISLYIYQSVTSIAQ